MRHANDLPDNIDALKAMLAEALASITQRDQVLEQMRQDMAERDLEIERLKAQIAKLTYQSEI